MGLGIARLDTTATSTRFRSQPVDGLLITVVGIKREDVSAVACGKREIGDRNIARYCSQVPEQSSVAVTVDACLE